MWSCPKIWRQQIARHWLASQWGHLMSHDSVSFMKIKNPIFEIQQRGKFLHKNNTVVPDSGKKNTHRAAGIPPTKTQ